MLDRDSVLYKWRMLDASYKRLVDTELHSRATARIIMDADILVVNRPDEVIDWIQMMGKPFLLGQPPERSPIPTTGQSPRHMQDVFKQKLAALNEAVGVPVDFLDGSTSGFYGCTSGLDLDLVQKVLSACIGLNIPMFEWGGEQCLVIYLLSLAGARRTRSGASFQLLS